MARPSRRSASKEKGPGRELQSENARRDLERIWQEFCTRCYDHKGKAHLVINSALLRHCIRSASGG